MNHCIPLFLRFRRLEYPLPELGHGDREKSRSIQNAHDWVYLGKSTIESGRWVFQQNPLAHSED